LGIGVKAGYWVQGVGAVAEALEAGGEGNRVERG
jgi:hypothetical protein